MLSGGRLGPVICHEREGFDDGCVTAWSISADMAGLEVGAASLNGSSSQVLIVTGGAPTTGAASTPAGRSNPGTDVPKHMGRLGQGLGGRGEGLDHILQVVLQR
jgi:hypothetical protein